MSTAEPPGVGHDVGHEGGPEVGQDALQDLPARLLRRSSRSALGSEATLREYADPPSADFELRPSHALAIVLVTQGTYVLQTGRGSSRAHALLRPGSSSVTAPSREVAARWRAPADRPLRSVHLHVAGHVLDEVADQLGRRGRTPDYLQRDDDFVGAAMQRLDYGVRHEAPRVHLDTLVHALVGHLVLESSTQPRSAPRPALAPTALQAVVDLMRDRLSEPLTLDELARAAHLSKHHFIRAFTAAVGRTPARHLTELRMEEARRLLGRSALPVYAVGSRVGYTNASSFAQAFRRATGVSPEAWRAERRRTAI